MSAASSPRTLAPSWLHAPDDANALDAAVWPTGADRDADGSLRDRRHRARPTSPSTFGTPLYVLDEDDVRAHARRTLEAFRAAAGRHGTQVRVYYAGKALLTHRGRALGDRRGPRRRRRAPGESSPSRSPPAPTRRGSDSTATTRASPNSSAPSTSASARSCSTASIELERFAAIVERTGGRRPCCCASTAACTPRRTTSSRRRTKTRSSDSRCRMPRPPPRAIREHRGLRFVGLHCHIGSQIFGTAGFHESAARDRRTARRAARGRRAPGAQPRRRLRHRLHLGRRPDRRSKSSPSGIVDAVARECEVRGIPVPDLAFEPGRAIVGQAGVTLYEVGTTKPVARRRRRHAPLRERRRRHERQRAARPLRRAVLRAHRARAPPTPSPALVRVVGKHCESGDIVVDAEYLPGDIAPGRPARGARHGRLLLLARQQLQLRPASARRGGARGHRARHRAGRDDRRSARARRGLRTETCRRRNG